MHRNFEWRVSPRLGEASGRFILGGSTPLPLGVPVRVDTDAEDGLGRYEVVLATNATKTKPLPGLGGILDFVQIRQEGLDPFVSTYSDYVDTVAVGSNVIVVNGLTVKGAWTNTDSDDDYLYRTGYPTSRVMVEGIGIATPTVGAGDYLCPGVGNDDDGYWEVTNNASEAWLVVTHTDNDTGLVEARVNF